MDENKVPAGLRGRKQERVRAELIRTGMRLFSRRGFDATTVDDIADAAEISRRTLFRYFGSKSEIVMAWTRGMSEFLAAALKARPLEEPPSLSLRESFLLLSPQIAENPEETYAVAVMIDRTPTLRPYSLQKHAEWEDVLAAVFVERLPDTADREQRARLLGRMGVAAFRTALDQWLSTHGSADFRELLTDTFALLEHVSQK